MPERNTCHHQGRAGRAATRNEHPEGAPWMLSSAGIRCHLRGDTLRQVLLAQSRLIAVTEQGRFLHSLDSLFRGKAQCHVESSHVMLSFALLLRSIVSQAVV